MTNYAAVKDGMVNNVYPWQEGDEVPEDHEMVELEDGSPVGANWTYDGSTFTPPPLDPARAFLLEDPAEPPS